MDLQRYEALLEMADLVVHHHSLPELFAAMAERLRRVAAADAANFSLYDPTKNVMRLHFWEGTELVPTPAEVPVEESPSGWAWQNQQPLVVPDLAADPRFPLVLSTLRDKGLRSYCWLPLTTAQKRWGTLGLGSSQTNAYGEKDMRLLPRVAKLVAVAVENALTREALVREKERLHMLLEVNNTLVANRDLQELFPAISGFMRRMIRHDYASVAVYDEAAHSLSFYPLDSPLTTGLAGMDTTLPVTDTPAGSALMERETKIFTRDDLMGIQSSFVSQMLEHGIQSLCCVPLTTHKGELGTLNLASKEANAFAPPDVGFLQQVAAQVAVALDNARSYREIAQLTDKLASEKLYLEQEIRSELNFEEIVGESPALKRVQGPSPKTCEVATIRLAYDHLDAGTRGSKCCYQRTTRSPTDDRALPVSGPIRPVALPSQARPNQMGVAGLLQRAREAQRMPGNSHPVQLDPRRDRAEDRFIAGDGHPPAKRTQKEGADSPGRVDFGDPQSTCVGGGGCVELPWQLETGGCGRKSAALPFPFSRGDATSCARLKIRQSELKISD